MELFFVLTFLFFYLYFQGKRLEYIGEEEKERAIPGIDESLAGLISVIMNADGHPTRSELGEVKYFLLKKFGEQKAKKILLILKQQLNKKIINFRPFCLQLNRNFSYEQRLDFLTLLFRIASSNNRICENEAEILQRVARHTAIREADFVRLKAKYASFYQYRRYTANTTSTVSSFKWACQTLSIQETATHEEIKRAYRKLAMQYHPDRMDRNNIEAQRAAAEKFRTINEAYRILKKNKQFA
jgi:DnaJ like chaperone protein